MIKTFLLLLVSTSCFAQIDTTNDLYRRNKELIDYIRMAIDSAKARPTVAQLASKSIIWRAPGTDSIYGITVNAPGDTVSKVFRYMLTLTTPVVVPTTTATFTSSTDKNFLTDSKLAVVNNTSGTNTGDQIISDATISTTDITTNNASTAKHGFQAKGDANILHFYRSDGTQATPTGVNSTITFLASDVINNNATANTIADVTGLSFAVTSGVTYRFKFYIVYTSAATTTGARFSINGPTNTFLDYRSAYSLTTTSRTFNEGLSTYDVPAASNASSAATGSNIAVIEGTIKPSANGTVIARFASEVLSSAITAKGTRSYVEFQAIN